MPPADRLATPAEPSAPGPEADPAAVAPVPEAPAPPVRTAWLTGPGPVHLSGPEGRLLVNQVRLRLLGALAAANLFGVVVVAVCITWVLPGTPSSDVSTRLLVVNSVIGAVFLLIVIPLGVLWGEAWLRSGRRWVLEEREPTDREVTALLRAPFRLFVIHAIVWTIAAFLFALVNALVDIDLLARVAFTIVLGGHTTAAFAYLLGERLMRPLASAALSWNPVDRPRLPGIVTRSVLVWTLGTGVPLAGLAITAIFALVQRDATATELAVTMLVLSTVGLVVGWWVTVLGARAVADPVRALRGGIARVAAGDLDTRIEVYDGSVLGLLQAGFNDMAAGLQERERVRDLYGRQVGEEVARDSLDRGFELGGQVCDVAVLFADVVGSTEIASHRPAEEVVELLNRFFAVVVDEVHARGGWINKFQGDATLAVFGAPAAVDDAAGRALATARAVTSRLPIDVAELSAGVGVAYGKAVAGHIGDERRFEFTVIGDPVNEASRLTELAKSYDPMVLASAEAVAAAAPEEAARWASCGEVELRGRRRTTRLARPVP